MSSLNQKSLSIELHSHNYTSSGSFVRGSKNEQKQSNKEQQARNKQERKERNEEARNATEKMMHYAEAVEEANNWLWHGHELLEHESEKLVYQAALAELSPEEKVAMVKMNEAKVDSVMRHASAVIFSSASGSREVSTGNESGLREGYQKDGAEDIVYSALSPEKLEPVSIPGCACY